MKFKWTVTGSGTVEFTPDEIDDMRAGGVDAGPEALREMAMESAYIAICEDQEFELSLAIVPNKN
jgi:hypothetical protein